MQHDFLLGGCKQKPVNLQKKGSGYKATSLVAIKKRMVFYDSCCVRRREIEVRRLAIGKEMLRTVQGRLQQSGVPDPVKAAKTLQHFRVESMAVHGLNPCRLVPSLLALVAAGTLVSCTPPPAPQPKGGVAVIDLDAAAKRLGRDAAIVQELKDAGGTLGEQLTQTRKEFQEEFEKSKSALGSKPTEADTQKLAELERSLNAQLQQKQQQAQQEIAAKRVALVNRFREEVKPLAMKIASAKGLGVVLVKGDLTVLTNDPDLDITDAVVAELTKPAGTPAPR